MKGILVDEDNPLNAELNPIRHLLALAGARHFVYVSRVRVNQYLEQAWTWTEGSRRLRVQDLKTFGILRWTFVGHRHQPHLSPRKYRWYSFLLEPVSTTVPQGDRKNYVNEETILGTKVIFPYNSDISNLFSNLVLDDTKKNTAT